MLQRLAQLVQGADLDLDGQLGVGGAGALHGGQDAAGGVDVVVLDEHHVIEGHAVVQSAAHAHGVLVQHAVAGQRLARVEHRRPGAGHGVHKAAGQRGDARQPLQES